MKISVVMPTYNDSKYITHTFDSLLSQSYENWELIIIDDGSTDNTKDVISNYISKNNCGDKIQYYYQKNKDQLNALQKAIEYISGDYVYILHSDDMLYSNKSFEDFIEFQRKNPNYDLYMGNLTIINGNGDVTGQKCLKKFKRNKSLLALMYLWLGRNILIDVAYFDVKIFKEKVKLSYLTWNMPAWIDIDNNYILNVKSLPFSMFRYRLDGNNYIDNEIGKQNILNGELRTAIYLMNSFSIPMYSLQYFIYRSLNKLGLGDWFRPIYFCKPEKNKHKIIDFIVRKRFPDGYENNKYFYSIYKFYENTSSRILDIEKFDEDIIIYKGCDMRTFNKLLNNNELNSFYYWFMDEMIKGFSKIKCKQCEKTKVEDLLKFFDIDGQVKVLVEHNE